MASAGSASSDKEDQVVAVLAARSPGPHFVEPERRLIFTRQNSNISIGRASKISAKGFVAAVDNAWFDSPVMSRGHAELTVDFNANPKAVYIKDVGSLHGTFHKRGDGSDGMGKEDKLESGQMVKLESGDTLRFGIDIYRSKETFPPCCVDFLIEENVDRPDPPRPNKNETVAARCFSVSVPDDDFDDEDVMSDGDDIIEMDIPLPPRQKLFPQSPPSTSSIAALRGPAIDLTQDVGEAAFAQITGSMCYQSSVTARNDTHSDVIDLTSEPEPESEPEQDEEPRRGRRQSTPYPIVEEESINVDTSISSNVTDTAGVPTILSSKPQDVPGGSGLDNAIAMDEDEDFRRTSETIIARASQMADLLYFSAPRYNDGDTSSVSSSEESPRTSSEEADSNLTDSDDHSMLTDVSIDDLDGQESDIGDPDSASSELGEEYSAIDEFEDEDEDLHYTASSPSSADDALDDSMFIGHRSPSLDSMPSSPFEPEPKTLAPKLYDSNTSEAKRFSEELAKHTRAATAAMNSLMNRPRLPSPSDAAMVKTLPFNSTCTTSTAQALGEKTGKYDYFAAREGNRVAFMNCHKSPPSSAIRETLAEGKETYNSPNRHGPTVHMFSLAPKRVMTNQLGYTPSSDASPTVDSPKHVPSPPSRLHEEPTSTIIKQDSLWCASGDKFINSPASVEPSGLVERTRLQSPEFDMTSAYTFQQSKLSKESKTGLTVRRVQIQDLLAQEPKYIEPGRVDPVASNPYPKAGDISKVQAGSKRTFNDAFAESDGTPRVVDTSYDEDTIKVDSAARAVQARQLSTDPSQSKQDSTSATISGDPNISNRPNTIRPAKRRRFAEVAACVALGGAGVLSALIMSAPTFT